MKTIIILIVLLIGIVSGCVGSERTYICDGDKLTLSGNTYHWYDNKHNYVWTGRYEEDVNTILIILDPPLPSIEMKKENNTLKYKNDIWVLQ